MNKILTVLLAIFSILPIIADGYGDDQEQFLDGYDYSLQNLITSKIDAHKAKVQAEEACDTATTGRKKWKIADYVTIPKFGGYIIGKYSYEAPSDNNQFSLRLVRLYVDGTVLKDFNYRVQFEINGNPGNGTGPHIVDAYLDWVKFKWLGIKAGQYKRCFSFENPMNPWDLSCGDYTQLVQFMTGMGTRTSGNYANSSSSGGRDIGVQLHGNLVKSKKNEFYYLCYQFGVYNGQGINVGDKDKEKDYIGNIQVQPLKGWKIGVFGWHGSYYGKNDYIAEDGTLDQKDYSLYFNRWAVGTSYESNRMSVRAEYARNHNTSSCNKTVSDSWNLTFGYRVWRWLKPYVRYDALRTDVETWNSLNSIYIVGLQARPHKNLQFQLQYNYIHNNAEAYDADGNQTIEKNRHQIWAEAYIRF